ncbi:unnamed protein product [Spirodela intermedia]|uniref:Uncharacterized protein n=1 Tax=Spirodela intermedia TaxID=51605 RepID=A0ABN7EAS2_SPIIN|nr:unnamed protein product [Spirodela intermedia]
MDGRKSLKQPIVAVGERRQSSRGKMNRVSPTNIGNQAQSGSSRERGLERLAWIDRGTCAPLPFHVTGGQPAVGQGVVVHARGLYYIFARIICAQPMWD